LHNINSDIQKQTKKNSNTKNRIKTRLSFSWQQTTYQHSAQTRFCDLDLD